MGGKVKIDPCYLIYCLYGKCLGVELQLIYIENIRI